MGELTKSSPLEDSTLRTSPPSVDSSSSSDIDIDTSTLDPPPSYTSSAPVPPQPCIYHIWNTPEASLKITTPDMTPLYTIHRHGSPYLNSTMRITGPGSEEDLYATITRHDSTSKKDDYIEIHMAHNNAVAGYTGTTGPLRLNRDGGLMTRRHKLSLSDGKTYILKGKHSSSFLMCWGNLKIVEEGSSQKTAVAEFKAEWPMSLHKMGTVTFGREVEDAGVAREMLFAFVGVAEREFVTAMATMKAAVPAAAAC